MRFIAKEGFSLIIIPLALSFICLLLSLVIGATEIKYILAGFSAAFFAFFIFNIYFFRDPERNTVIQAGGIVAPADGRIIFIGKVFDNRFLNKKAMKISIFMSLFNVHVNRVPVSGRVTDVIYNKGRFFSANLDKASLENEYNAITIETNGKGLWSGQKVAFVQIAGFMARRIVCNIKKGEDITAGTRFGLIKYGSRLDIYLPLNSKIYVKKHEKVFAGKTAIGKLS